jgi:hypothetical protein
MNGSSFGAIQDLTRLLRLLIVELRLFTLGTLAHVGRL